MDVGREQQRRQAQRSLSVVSSWGSGQRAGEPCACLAAGWVWNNGKDAKPAGGGGENLGMSTKCCYSNVYMAVRRTGRFLSSVSGPSPTPPQQQAPQSEVIITRQAVSLALCHVLCLFCVLIGGQLSASCSPSAFNLHHGLKRPFPCIICIKGVHIAVNTYHPTGSKIAPACIDHGRLHIQSLANYTSNQGSCLVAVSLQVWA